mmetsp:Transcript_13310/g.28265  ORF Transcript_13310/g.28265 Transcript_13310/m.28265 type:complete len:444 (+) Transcript_13310:314-1645(+)
MRNVPRYAAAAPDGSASAGSSTSSASGCSPWMTPVMYVPTVNLRSSFSFFPCFFVSVALWLWLCPCEWLWSRECEWAAPGTGPCEWLCPWECECPGMMLPWSSTSSSIASLTPSAPISISVTPTTPCPHCEMSSMSMATWFRSSRNTSPNRIWPVLWPHPQSPPSTADCARDLPMVSGASAARWSGPVSVCSTPARIPAPALCSTCSGPLAAELAVGVASWRVTVSSAEHALSAMPVHAAPRMATSAPPTSSTLRLEKSGSSSRMELSATSRVDPSCSSTVSHSGMRPNSAAVHVPTTARAARTRFCMTMRLVRCAILRTCGSTEIPACPACSSSTSATLAAASVGVFTIATPTSAHASAGVSLIPSPTIITRWRSPVPSSRASVMRRILSSGRRPLLTWWRSRPTAAATFLALSWLSPVRIITRRPSVSVSSATASRLRSCT